MRLLYTPFGIISGLIASRIGRKVFRALWSKVDDAAPPKPGSGQGGLGKVVAGQAAQAAVMAGTAAVVDRIFARGFHHLLGIWPKKPETPKEDD